MVGTAFYGLMAVRPSEEVVFVHLIIDTRLIGGVRCGMTLRPAICLTLSHYLHAAESVETGSANTSPRVNFIG